MKRKTDNFNKFYNKKRNSAIKEQFRQEKKAAKKERKEAIERHFEEKRKARFGEAPAAPTGRNFKGKGAGNGRPGAGAEGAGRGEGSGEGRTERGSAGRASQPGAGFGHMASSPGKGLAPNKSGKSASGAPIGTSGSNAGASGGPVGDELPLNKYIAHGGICSRREAADMIRHGKVSVNGQTVTEPGTKVLPTDTVKVGGKKVTISRNFVYILLNKPKDYITTTDDPQGRKTVLDLIRHATLERVYPIGRLDRNTSGVLLLTNDGDLSQKLAHPSHEIKKIYHVTLDKPLTKADFDKIIGGQVVLEDGVAFVDVLAYADPKDKMQIGLEIHSGRNRIVRRIFEHLGYDVRGLDRVMYAGLTKKNVQRGKWRFLTEKELRVLKYLNSSMKGSPARAKEWAAAAALSADDVMGSAVAPAGKPARAASGKAPRAAGEKLSRTAEGKPQRAAGERPSRVADGKPPRDANRKPVRDSNGKPPRAAHGKYPRTAAAEGSEKRPRAGKRPRPDSADRGKRSRPDFTPASERAPRNAGSRNPAPRNAGPRNAEPRNGAPRNAPATPEKPFRNAAPPASGKRAPIRPGKRPASSIPPKGRKSAAAPNKFRPRKSTNFTNEEE